MNNNRIIWIDYLKAFAIIGVIGIHVSSILLDNKYMFTLPWYESVISASIFRYAIVIFIMASGYLLLRKVQPITVIPKRLKRILIPFIFWLIIYAIIKVLIKDAIGTTWTVFDLILFILKSFIDPLSVSVQFWYIYMILGLYLLSPILSKWIHNATISEIEYILLIWIIVSVLQFIGLHSVLLDYLRYFTGAIGYFILGYYLTVKKSRLLESRRFGLLLFIMGSLFTIIGTIIASFILHTQSLFFIRLGDLTPGAFMQAIGLFIIIKNINYSKIKPEITKIVTKISKDCYGIYLVNILILNLLEKINIINLEKHTIPMIIITIILVLVLSDIIIDIMHKIPITRRFSGKG